MKRAAYLILSIILFLATDLKAQKPINDSCSRPIQLLLGKGNFGINTYIADSVLIDSATVQIGEYFHSSLISAGNDKKSVWYRFYLPARRGVNIELKQTANAIAVRDCGFTTFYSNTCLPSASMATAAKITTLNQFGSSFHPCMEPGWYLVQVSAKARAEGKVYLEITTSFPYQNSGVNDAKFDIPDSAYYFGDQIVGKPGYKSVYKDFELGCYTIKDSTEYMYSMGSKYNRYTQSAWFVFKALDYADATMFSIEAYNAYLGSGDTMAYRIYRGDCRGGGALQLLDSNYTDFGSANRCYSYYGAMNIHKSCFFDSGKYYTIQFLFHKDESRIMRFTITDATSAYDSSSNYKPVNPRIVNFGNLGNTMTYYDGFSCKSRMSYNPCSNANMAKGVNMYGYRYNLSNWYKFKLTDQSKLDVLLYYPPTYNIQFPGEMAYRIFKDTATNACSDIDTSRLVASGRGGAWYTHMCLEKGDYVIQVMGLDTVPLNYNGCYGNMHLGRDYSVYLNTQKLAKINRFSLFGKKWADSVYVQADTLSPIPIFQNVYMGMDTISCQNNVKPASVCDTVLHKNMYRVFKIGDFNKDGKLDSGLIYINGLRTIYAAGRYRSDHRIFKGNALKLRNTQSISLYPDTIKGLRPYTSCFGQSTSVGSYCMEPGEYTLVSSFDDYGISLNEQPYFTFYSNRTRYTSYARAENLGKISSFGAYYGNLDTFSCSVNPDTIDGIYCGRRNTYHVFYLDSISVATIGINYYYAYAYAGTKWSLFTGDIRNGKTGLKRYVNDGEWTCGSNYYARTTTDCKPMMPGWYTVMASNDMDIGYDSSKRNNSVYSGYYLYNSPHRIELSFRKPNIILPKYDKPYKSANIDSLLNGGNALSFPANYSAKKGLPQHLEKFQFPTEFLQCDLDTPFTHYPKSKLCKNNATNLVYYTFRIAKASWASINTVVSGLNSFKLKLYNFDVRKYASRLDTANPIQNCTENPYLIEFCNLKPGVYTLVYFVNRYSGQNSYLTPTLNLDSIMVSRFDHAKSAYDFGRILGDSAWHSGRNGDVHPFDTSLVPSNDVITCSTGSQISDPAYNNCYTSWNPYVYNKDSFRVMFPNDSAYLYRNNNYYYYNQYAPRRNIWYTFTHQGAGKLNFRLNTISQKYSDITRHLRFIVYVSDVNGSTPFDTLKLKGGLDSSTAQGLSYVTSDGPYTANYGWYYCYYPSNFTASLDLPICDNQPLRRYYIVVDADNNPDVFPYTFNHHVSMSIMYDSSKVIVQKTKGDFYSQAISFPDTATSKNLLANNSGQFDALAWTHTFYNLGSTTTYTPRNQGTSLSAWTYYFLTGYVEQIVDLKEFKSKIKANNCVLDFSGEYMLNAALTGTDGIDFRILYYDSLGALIQTLSTSPQNCSTSAWASISKQWAVPANARTAKFRVYVVNSYYTYPTLYLHQLKLFLKQSGSTVYRGNVLESGIIYEAQKNYMGQSTIDALDYKVNGRSCGRSVWYKIKVDTTGYLFFNASISYNSGYVPGYSSNYGYYSMRLFRETIPGDSINGLSVITTNVTYNTKIGTASYACVSPGTYYLMSNVTCIIGPQTCYDYVQPILYLEYQQGDYCSNSIYMKIDTLEKVNGLALVDCKTIGTDFGEDGSDMGCLFGPKGYKSTWFKVEYTDTQKVDLEFKLAENTTSKSSEIRYRTYYGNCQNLTAAPCNTNSQTSFIINCIRKGTYYVQVVTPVASLGTIQLSVEAKKNNDSTCKPVDIFQPNAAFYYNTSCPENVIEFVNTSSRGDSVKYLWSFGYNNQKSTALNPAFAYPASTKEKSYKVKLVVSMKTRPSKDSIIIDVLVPYSPSIDIVNRDTNLCDGDSIWLKTKVSHFKGYWNNGSDKDTIKVGRTGMYYYRMREKPNLLKNANAEFSLNGSGWTQVKGSWGQRYYSPNARDSTYYFWAGTSSGESELTQTVNVSQDSVEIDSGIAKTSFTGWIWTKIEDVSDQVQLVIEYYDKNNNLLANYNSGYLSTAQEWLQMVHSRSTPKGTRSVKVRLFVNNQATDAYCDAFFDNLSLRMRSACDYQDSVYVQINPYPKVKLGRDTSFCYHDSLILKPIPSYIDPFVVNDKMDGSALKGEILVSASYIPAYKYTILSRDGVYDFGAVNYVDAKLKLTDSFDLSADLLIGNKDGPEGTWTAFYLFNSQKPADYNFYYNGGYSIFIQDYNNSNQLILYWGSSALAVYNLNMRLSEQGWKNFTIKYRNKKFEFYINGKLFATYFDNTSRTQAGNNFGILASNHYGGNTHLVRNYYITRSKSNVQIQNPANWNFKYSWNDNTSVAAKKITASGTYIVRLTDKYGCVSNYDTIVVNRIKTYDSLLTGNYKVCALLDTFRIIPLVKKGYFYGNPAIDSSGLITISKANFGVNTFMRSTNDTFGCHYKDTGLFVVDSVPDIVIAPVNTVCKNAAPFNVQVNYVGGYFSGGTYIDSSGKFNPALTVNAINKVYYRTKGLYCVGVDSINIRVDSIPSAKIAPAGPFCKNAGIKTIVQSSNAGGKFSGGLYIDSTGKFNPNTAGVGTKKVYYTFTDSRSCKNTDSITVRVDSIPSAKIAAAGPFCKNAGIKQINNASSAGGKYSGGTYVDSTGKFNPNTAGVGTKKVYYTFTDSRSCKNTDSITVRVDSIPSAKIAPAGPFCKNAGIKTIVQASNPGGKFSGGLYIDSTGKFNPNTAGVGNKKVYYTFTDSRSCKNTDSITVRVDSIPSAKIAPAGPFCKNAGIKTIVQSSNAGGKFSGGLYIDSTGKFNPNTAGVGNKKVYYTFTDSRSCKNTDSITVRVDSIPSAKIAPAGPFCKNAGIKQINNASNSGGKYSGGFYIDSTGKFNPNTAGVGNKKVYYTFTDSRSCKNTDSIIVRVDSIPSAKIAPAGPFCKNAGIKTIVQASNPGGKFSGGLYIDSTGKFNPNTAGVGNKKVYYTFTDSRSCKNTDSITVRVDSIPSAKIAAAGPFCKNAGIKTIIQSSNAGGKFSGGLYIDSTGKFNPNTAGVGNKKVYYTFTDSRSCKNTDSITVRVDSIPSAKIAPAGPFCKNAGIKQINNASNAGGKYSGGLYIDSTGKFNPNTAGVGTKKVYYTFTDSRSCKNTDSITVRVDSIPSAKIAPAGPFCKNAGIKTIVQASNAGGKFSGGLYIDSTGKFNPNTAGVGNKKVYYTFTDSRSCKNTDSITVRVDSIPSAKIAPAGPFCKNASIKTIVQSSNPGGKFSGGTYIDSTGKFNPNTAGVGNKKVYYTFTDSRSCKNTDSITVRVDSIPSAKIAAAGPFCKNAGIKQINNASNAGGKYSGGTYVDSTGKFNPNTAGVGTKKVYYTFTDSRSCKNTDSITVRVDSIPSAKIAPAGPFCKNAGIKTIVQSSNAGGKYSGGTYIDSTGKFNPNIAGVGNKKVYYTFADSRLCKNTDSITVRVDSIPSAKIAPAGPFCKNVGIKTIVQASNAGGKFSGGLYIDSTGKFNPNTAGVGNKKVYYTFTDSRSCKNTDSITVRVDSIPSAKIAAAGPFCKNAGIKQISNASNSGGKYSGGTYVDSTGKFNPNTAGVGNKKVYYTFTDSRSCKNTDSITVRIDSIPSAKIAPAGPFCKNAGIKTIVQSSNAGGKFSGGTYIDSTGKFNPNTAGVGNKKVYYTFTDSRLCKNTDSITVRVDSIPSAKISPAGPFCKNAGIKTIVQSSNAGGKFSGGLYIDSTGKFNPNTAGVGNKKVYYTFTDSRSCKNTDSITIRVDSIPSAKIAPAGPFCKNAGIKQINNASNSGGKYSGGTYIDSTGKFNPNTAGVGTKKVYYTFTDSRSCKNTDSITVRIDSIPSAKIAPAGPFCKNAGVKTIVQASNAGGKFSGGLYIDSTGKFNPNTAGVGNKKVYYTFTDSRSCKNTDSITVRVDSIPSAKIAPAGPFCKNAGVKTIVQASNPGGKFSGGTYIDSTGKFSPNTAGVGNKKVYYTFTDSRSCKNTDSITVRVDSIPSAKIAPAGPFCKNAGIKQINNASNAGGKYSGGLYIDSTGKFNPNIAVVGNKKVYYTFTDSRSCKNTDSITVRVDSIPSAKIAVAGPFCKNAGIKTIVQASNAGGKFSGGNYIDSTGKFNPITAGVGNKKVFYTFTDSRLCKNTDSITVIVDSIPSASIAAAGPFCKNAGIKQINNASNPGGKFIGGLYIDSTGKFNPLLASIGNQKVYYTFTDSRSCKNTDSITVRVDSIPSVKIAAAGPFCKNAGIKQINNASNAGGKYSGGLYIDSTGKFNPSIAGVGNKKVYYTFTDSRFCKNTDSITIQIDSFPSAKIAAAGPYCENAGMQKINPLINFGGKFRNGKGIDSLGNFSPSVAAAGQHTVYYSFTSVNNCSNTDSIIVTVYSKPDAGILSAGPFCANASAVQLKTKVSGGSFNVNAYTSSSGIFDPAKANIGFNTVFYSLTNSNNCSNNDSLAVEVWSIPTNTILVIPDKGCAPLKVKFSTQVEDKILWKLNSITYTNASDSAILNNAGSYTLSLQVSNIHACTVQLKNDIQVFPTPFADFTYSPDPVYLNQPLVTFTDISKGSVNSWKWHFGDGDSSTQSNPMHPYNQSGNYLIDLFITDVNGCKDSVAYTLTVMDNYVIFIPNAFTPNGNGRNEVFSVEGMGIKSISCSIFNRWGEKLYESDNFKQWDGMYRGEYVQDGAYLYVMTVKDTKGYVHYLSGEIYVLR